VNVLKDGEHIRNSPFKLLVSEGDASKVKAWGPGLEEGTANETNEFTVDTGDAGHCQKIAYITITGLPLGPLNPLKSFFKTHGP